jgi:hypothetical protein
MKRKASNDAGADTDKRAKMDDTVLSYIEKNHTQVGSLMNLMFSRQLIVSCTGDVDDDEHEVSDLACMDPHYSRLMQIADYSLEHCERLCDKLCLATVVRSIREMDAWQCNLRNIVLILDGAWLAKVSILQPFAHRVLEKIYALPLVSKKNFITLRFSNCATFMTEFTAGMLRESFIQTLPVSNRRCPVDVNISLILADESLLMNSDISQFTMVDPDTHENTLCNNYLNYADFGCDKYEYSVLSCFFKCTWFVEEVDEEEEDDDDEEEDDDDEDEDVKEVK